MNLVLYLIDSTIKQVRWENHHIGSQYIFFTHVPNISDNLVENQKVVSREMSHPMTSHFLNPGVD